MKKVGASARPSTRESGDKRFDGKVALVTGSSRGIGASIALAFAAEGCAVVVNYRRNRRAAEAIVDVIGRERAVAIKADVADPEAAADLVERGAQAFGRLDILVNNAGFGIGQALGAIVWNDVDRQVGTNILAAVATIRASAPHLAPNKGSIVNVSSLNARSVAPGASIYSATKAALEILTRALARELGPEGVRLNCVAPGIIATSRRLRKLSSEDRRAVIDATPLGRLGVPEDVARVVLFLASSEAAWITGETISVNGGYGI